MAPTIVFRREFSVKAVSLRLQLNMNQGELLQQWLPLLRFNSQMSSRHLLRAGGLNDLAYGIFFQHLNGIGEAAKNKTRVRTGLLRQLNEDSLCANKYVISCPKPSFSHM